MGAAMNPRTPFRGGDLPDILAGTLMILLGALGLWAGRDLTSEVRK